VLLTRAYTLAPAARLGPLTYSSVLLASLYGWWLWGEVPGPATFAGAALVVLAGLLATRPVPLSGPAGAAARA
jgi:drug/metabolite transporter (DMT)-like permease